jgi:radical SAM protein with 4Fe4S-binding SPASM domain
VKEFSEFKIFNHIDRIQAVLRGERPAPVTLEIDPTNSCNHNCIWCIDALHREEHHNAMLPREVALQAVADAKAMGVRSLVVKGGGEPLVYPHIAELLRFAKQCGFEVGVITNGERILDFADVIEETCTWLRISLDAGSAETHQRTHRAKNPQAFDKIWSGVQRLADKVYIGIIYIIHPATFHEMALAAKRAKASGCRYIAFKRVVAAEELFDTELYMTIDANYLFARRQYDNGTFSVFGFRIYNFTKGVNATPYKMCKGHHLVGILGADGNVYACCSTRGNLEYRFGNVHEQSLAEIWQGEKRRQVLQAIDDGRCRQICLGHTSYMRYDHYNELFEYLAQDDKPHGNFL